MQNTSIYNVLRYSLIAFPLAFAGIPIYLHAPDYYSVIMGLEIEIIGFSLLFLRIFDAFLDPLIGLVSDRYFNLRDKIIYFGAFLLFSGFWMIFHPINSNILIWFCLSIFICTLGFSVLSINLQAFVGLWDVPREKITKIITIRESIGLIGLLISAIIPTALYSYYGEDNFHIFSIFLFFILIITLIFFSRWHKFSVIKKPKKISKNDAFRIILKNRNAKLFFTSYFLSAFAASIPATLIIFYVRDYLMAESFLGYFLVVYFTSGALSMPLWKFLSKRYSCTQAWLFSMILAITTFIWAYFIRSQDITEFFIICLFSGMAVGANLALPSSIIAEYIYINKHEEYAASYYSVNNFLSKFSLAIAAGIALPILGFMNYKPGLPRVDDLFPITYALIPCIIQATAIFVILRLIKSKT